MKVLVSFGRSDPLHLTEALHKTGFEATYVWGPHFNRPMPLWAFKLPMVKDIMESFHMVYCGHGATLLEATAAGCQVMVLTEIGFADRERRLCDLVKFTPAWTGAHLDHSGQIVRWWEPGSMEAMARELRRRKHNE